MLAVFRGDNGEVLICEVDSEGKPETGSWFKLGTGRVREDYDLTLVKAPISITTKPIVIPSEYV